MNSVENLTEASLNRIYQKTKNHAVGAVTAFRGDKTKAENKANNKKVLAYLMNAGYSVIKVKGSYWENFQKEAEGLKTEKRMIQSTDRKIFDVNRQSEIDKEIKRLEK